MHGYTYIRVKCKKTLKHWLLRVAVAMVTEAKDEIKKLILPILNPIFIL